MLTRKKLRKILRKYKQELKKDYFKKLKNPADEASNINKEKIFFHLKTDQNPSNQTNEKNTHNKNCKATSVGTFVRTHYLNFNAKIVSCVKTDTELSKNIKNYEQLEIFHTAIKPILLLGQCFGIMPIVAVSNPNPRKMRFSYKSLPMLVTLVFLISNGLLLAGITKHLIIPGINAKNFVGIVFFGFVEIACFLFFWLARRWPNLIDNWTQIELIFTQSPYEEPERNLKKRVRFAAFAIVLCSIIEHFLFHTSSLLSYTRRLRLCAQVHNSSGIFIFDEYMRENYAYVFTIFSYSKFIAVYILITCGISTFVWNYMDLFIIIISKGIAYRFEQIMMRINKITQQEVSEHIFIEIRIHYVKMCELLDRIDEHLSGIILLSCLNNLYFVCYQLLNIFNKLRWPINYIYFWYSLLYLIVRTAFVFLTAASINDESKSALSALRSVSHKTWCVEVERLIFQMTTQTVALSGKKFYFLTRRLIFGMAGTIVTYELVLLQFDEPNRAQGLPPLC